MRLNTLYFAKFYVAIISMNIAQCEDSKEKSFSTSIASMEQLLFMEQLLIDTVASYAKELQIKVDVLKNLISELRTENQRALTNPEEYLQNPLNGYALIRRTHQDWPNIELYMNKPVGGSHLEVLHRYRSQLPTSSDLYDASEAIYRLQVTYDLQPSDMAEGILNGKPHNVKLKSIDRYFIGYHLLGRAEFYHAGFWIYSALGSYVASDYNTIVGLEKEKVWSLYAETLLKQNRPEDALAAIQQAIDLLPEDAYLLKRRKDIEYLVEVNNLPPYMLQNLPPSSYELGCRGAFSIKRSRFHCIYNSTTSAFLRLAPLKMEILQLQPYIVIYHDVISAREIKYLQEMAKPNLERSKVYREDLAKYKVIERRTSQFSFIQDEFSNTTRRVNQRIEDMTGFDITGSEKLQVMNYGLGGHYDIHYDFFNVSDGHRSNQFIAKSTCNSAYISCCSFSYTFQQADIVRQEGDRICTVLFYLSDVEQGGATVFPNIHTAVFPRKGSAVVWYNLNNRLEGDWRTLHAACPVIVGSKWVANKWIRAKGQMFRRPCYK